MDIHESASASARPRLDGIDKLPAKDASLPRGIDRQHPEICALAVTLQVHAATKRSRQAFQQEKLAAAVHQLDDLIGVCAIAYLEKCFDDERVIDDARQVGGVVNGCGSQHRVFNVSTRTLS